MALSKENAQNRQMVVGGLGRPFTLGMLYNAPKDELISGMALWDSRTLQSLTVSRPQSSSHFDISASDSTEDSSFNLSVDVSLKLSFMGGLIKVGGSANYLNDKKESKNRCRLTLQYQATTHFEQLSLTADGQQKIQSSQISEGLATHVVTGIEYGANAFFVFDSQRVESSNLQSVKGQMELIINQIPTVEIHGEANIELTQEEKHFAKTLSVKFYGDFLLESNPATFDAAVQTYMDLPKLMMGADGKGRVNTVPVKVWLQPLEVFTLQPGPVIKSISVGLVLEAEDSLEDLSSIKMWCKDCLSVSAVGKFPQLQHQLLKFYKLCHYYTVELQRRIAETCPAIRVGTETESVLRSLFYQRHMTPFSQDKLTQWLEHKEREVSVVQSCLDIMTKIPVVSSLAEVHKFVLAPGKDERWGFIFTSLGTRDAQLEEMGKYLKAMKLGSSYESPTLECREVPWFYRDEVVARMRRSARGFQNSKLSNIIAAIDDTEYIGSVEYKYIDGILVLKMEKE